MHLDSRIIIVSGSLVDLCSPCGYGKEAKSESVCSSDLRDMMMWLASSKLFF